MKYTLMITLCIVLMMQSAVSQITVNRPRFLVENQLIPYTLKLQTELPVSKSVLSTSTSDNQFNHKELFVDSYLLPVVSSEKNLTHIIHKSKSS